MLRLTDEWVWDSWIVDERDGGWALVGFRNREGEGVFDRAIGDPVRVRLDDDGDGLTLRPAPGA